MGVAKGTWNHFLYNRTFLSLMNRLCKTMRLTTMLKKYGKKKKWTDLTGDWLGFQLRQGLGLLCLLCLG